MEIGASLPHAVGQLKGRNEAKLSSCLSKMASGSIPREKIEERQGNADALQQPLSLQLLAKT